MTPSDRTRLDAVARLRGRTGAPLRHVVRALNEAGGDVARAEALLREHSPATSTESLEWHRARGNLWE